MDIHCFANDSAVSVKEPEIGVVRWADDGGEGADLVADGKPLVGDAEAGSLTRSKFTNRDILKQIR